MNTTTAAETSTTQTITFATAVPTEIADTLDLGHVEENKPRPNYIGYWRSSEIGGGSPHHRMLEQARVGAGGKSSFTINGIPAAEYYAGVIDRYEQECAAWDTLPWPGDYIDPSMPEHERERVAVLLDAAPIVAGYCGSSSDRLGGDDPRSTGSQERALAGWCWPSGLSYYVRTYGLRLDPVFIEAISR
jgi:hypothetical protein